MSNVLETVVIKIGYDVSDLQRGQKQADQLIEKTKKTAQYNAKGIGESAKNATDFFVQLRKAALSYFAVLATGKGLVSLTDSVISGGANLYRLSQNLGISAKEISTWGNAVRMSGGSAEAFQGTIKMLSAAVTDLKTFGHSSLDPLFQKFNIHVLDATTNKALPFADVLMQIGDALNNLPDPADRFNIGKQFGLDEGTIALLTKGRKEVERMLQVSSKNAMSDADAKKAAEAQQKWEDLKNTIENLWRDVAFKLLPTFERLAPVLIRFAEIAIPWLVKLLDEFNRLDEATGGVSTQMTALVVAFGALNAMGIIGAITGITKALWGMSTASVSAIGGLAKIVPLAAAGGLGYGLGTYIYNNDLAGTSVGDFIGESTAKVASFFGNSDATKALDINGSAGINLSTPIKQGATGSIPSVFYEAAAKYNRDPMELYKIWMRESSGGKNMKSPKGARGHMGLMPATQKDYGVTNPDDLRQSVFAAAHFLSDRSREFGGDNLKVWASYNWGQGNVRDLGLGAAHKETRDYLEYMTGRPWADLMASENGGGNTNQTINVSQVMINTKATDAKGIASDFKNALVAQANTGLR